MCCDECDECALPASRCRCCKRPELKPHPVRLVKPPVTQPRTVAVRKCQKEQSAQAVSSVVRGGCDLMSLGSEAGLAILSSVVEPRLNLEV